jgi:hypothetical protein
MTETAPPEATDGTDWTRLVSASFTCWVCLTTSYDPRSVETSWCDSCQDHTVGVAGPTPPILVSRIALSPAQLMAVVAGLPCAVIVSDTTGATPHRVIVRRRGTTGEPHDKQRYLLALRLATERLLAAGGTLGEAMSAVRAGADS